MVTQGKSPKRFDRLAILTIVIFILAALVILALFNLQVIRGDVYAAIASGQHKVYQALYPVRGSIYINRPDYSLNSHLYPIATNEERQEIYAVPKDIKEPEEPSEKIAKVLNLDPKELLEKFSKKDDPYEPILVYATDKQVEAVKSLKIEGIGFVPRQLRVYPEANVYSQITGFLGYEKDKRVGQYGLEGAKEKILAGTSGKIALEADILGNWIPTSLKSLKSAVNGSDIVLTIDNSIQYFACNAIKEGVKQYEADSGSVIILNPQTGAILALCGYPDFDPNKYSEVKDINFYENKAVAADYEPGSTFKVFTMAASIDAGAVTPETKYQDPGFYEIDDFVLRNFDDKSHGTRTMTQILEESLNTGAIFAMRKAGQKTFKEYVKKFGFGKLTGIELTPESPGDISNLERKGEIYSATASFGQGITVTPIQLITAFTAIVNDGAPVKPYIVAKTIRPDGKEIIASPKKLGQVIEPETAEIVRAMLVSVINNGHAKGAQVPGYFVAGKTGTAQVAKKNGLGYSGLTIHSFIGFAPVDNPAFVALVKYDHPRAVSYAEGSAVPTFQKIAKFILDYYEVPPDK